MVQLRRHQPRGDAPPARRERARRAGVRHAPATGGAAAVVDVDRAGAQPRGPRADARGRAARLGEAGAALRRRLRLGAGRAAWVRARVRLAAPALWAPGRPRLTTCGSRSPASRGCTTRVGLRELRWDGGRAAASTAGRSSCTARRSTRTPPAAATRCAPADMDAIVARLKAIGANATRSQHPLTPALLERLDAAGILVWQGVGPVDAPGAWTSTHAGARARAPMRRVRTTSCRPQTHPSVIAWNLANEVAGNGHDGGQREPTSPRAARALHRLDPGRPVALDVWGTHLPERAGAHLRATSTRSARRTTRAGTTAPARRRPRRAPAIARLLRRLQRAFPGKVARRHASSAPRPTRRNPPGAPGEHRVPGAPAGPPHRAPTAPTRGSTGCSSGTCRTSPLAPDLRRRLDPQAGARHPLARGINQKGLFTYGGRRSRRPPRRR